MKNNVYNINRALGRSIAAKITTLTLSCWVFPVVTRWKCL